MECSGSWRLSSVARAEGLLASSCDRAWWRLWGQVGVQDSWAERVLTPPSPAPGRQKLPVHSPEESRQTLPLVVSLPRCTSEDLRLSEGILSEVSTRYLARTHSRRLQGLAFSVPVLREPSRALPPGRPVPCSVAVSPNPTLSLRRLCSLKGPEQSWCR